VQFHPEFKSKPLKPHPLFAGFVDATYKHMLAARQTASTPAETLA
jgi:CTP synthase (UTP-ammonia lyase)